MGPYRAFFLTSSGDYLLQITESTKVFFLQVIAKNTAKKITRLSPVISIPVQSENLTVFSATPSKKDI